MDEQEEAKRRHEAGVAIYRSEINAAIDAVRAVEQRLRVVSGSRELSLAVTKLDEAVLWLREARDAR